MEEGSSTGVNSTSFDAYNGRLQTAALTATRKAATLPVDIVFHRSMDQSLAQDLDSLSKRVLSITNRLLGLASPVDQTQSKGKGKAKLESEDDVVDNFHSAVVDTIDQLLEKTDICLDEFLGKNKAPAIPINPPITHNKPGAKVLQKPSGKNEPVIQHAAHLIKPQLNFKKPPDNSDSPWHPTLTHKYNAKVPLGHSYQDPDAESRTLVSNHPYRYEIAHVSYPPRMFKPCTPTLPPSLEDTTATWVDSPSAFQAMLSKLKNATEIAVDLEHHSYRSYAGFLCLMQISDREEDWVVDLLAVRGEVEALNEIFTDPVIVKVFHGADSDIVWLQQDFNLYVVNLFDTFHASKLLEFPRHGLANLLEMYCDFVPDKRYQLADWRIRPLPQEMLLYARSDTHFLLFIYDNLRNALLDRSKSSSRSPTSSPPPGSSGSSSSKSKSPTALLDQALARSAETSLRVYTKEPYDAEEGTGPGGWDTLAKRWNKGVFLAGGPGVGVGAMQREVYKAVHAWREKTAREEDESTRYVLQNHFLFMLAEEPPADMAALLKVFRTSVPPLVKRRAKELLNVVREAVKRGLPLVHPGSKTAVEEIATEEVVVETLKDVVMLESEIKSLESVEGKAKNIWGATPTTEKIVSKSHSSLFGLSKGTTTAGGTRSTGIAFSTTVSTLFGTGRRTNAGSNGAASSTSKSVLESTHFKELVTKINKSLALAPSVPQFPAVTSSEPDVTPGEPKQEVDEATGMEVEIPYVPASQRATKQIQVKEESDTIVVVGQARKKRKRKAAETAGGEESAPPKKDEGDLTATKMEGADEEEPFDFAKVPNILDDNPDLEEGSKKRKRQKKQGNKGGTFYGDFPAPPKAYSEVKSGNQSYTFK
ncbi:hypothetical protein NLJ89_g4693 [Agrocybe chaxingu]|uniref:HRDC domain-containing protein n=1 Tax=Agrocybe chaxingu TaxID=84603 RepID=A0A9W8MXI4_9AGAR|nr:hypothetical protein NLJ89_g4693 [Agrocybe chaxingu]